MGMDPGPGQEPYDDGQNEDYGDQQDYEDGNYDIPDLHPKQMQKHSHRAEENEDEEEDKFGRMRSFKGNAKDIFEEEQNTSQRTVGMNRRVSQ